MRCSDSTISIRRVIAVRVLAALVLCLSAQVDAQQAAMTPEQMQQALARAQSLLRQVAQQKATLEAELAQLRVDNAGLSKRLKRAEGQLEERASELAASETRADRTDAQLERTRGSLERTRGQLEETVAKYKELAALHRETVDARDQFAETLAATQRELADAQVRNRALYDIGQELLALYEGKSAWDSLLQGERASGLKKVELQNRLQEIETRLFDELTDESVAALRRAGAEGAETPDSP